MFLTPLIGFILANTNRLKYALDQFCYKSLALDISTIVYCL